MNNMETILHAAVSVAALVMGIWIGSLGLMHRPTLSTVIRDAATLSDNDKRRLLDNFNYLETDDDDDAGNERRVHPPVHRAEALERPGRSRV